MKTITVQGQERNKTGTSSARNIRNRGFVPGVIYGSQEGKKLPLHFMLPINEVRKITREKSCFIDINVGKNTYMTMLQEKQIHPVSDQPIHLDLLAISPGQVIKMDIPLTFVGKAIGVTKGGLMVQKMRTLKVKATMEQMPEKIEAHVSHLDLGNTLRAKEVKTENFELLSSPNLPIGAVEIPRSMRSSKNKTAEEQKPAS